MAAKKKAAAKTTDSPTPAAEPRDTATNRPRVEGGEQQIAVDDGSGPEPSEINSSLSSDRMKKLLADHRAMGARPG
jgi:hypothetical protein